MHMLRLSTYRSLALAAALALPALAGPLLVSSPANAAPTPESFADLVEQLLPTVVNISTTQNLSGPEAGEFEEFFEEYLGPEGMPEASALGSGFIIDPAGYIVTNHHVIAGADQISVRLADDTVLPATLIGSDEKSDLALLKVESPTPLPSTTWGDSDAARIGDWVIAIGNPFGLGGTVTAGIVSARGRDINSGPYDDFLQTDAAINRGNSGGPMFNVEGQVIGVNSAIYSPSGGSVGIGFAIPATIAKNVIDQLREHGEVRRGWLGVRIQNVTEELAEGLRMDKPHGALVAAVTPDGPAAAAGIQQGDVIITFDGKTVPDSRKLPRMVAETPIGTAVDVVIWRKGEAVTLQVTLGELTDEAIAATSGTTPPSAAGGKVAALGVTLAALTDALRAEHGLDAEVKGVLVTEVDPKGSAAAKDVQPGDVIVEVDQEEVASPADVARHIEKAKVDGYRVVTLLLYRAGDFQWVAVRIDQQ
jgi:serine protease Do